jgi:hypothetical protein
MPANAGIQVRFSVHKRLDSGFRRNDGNKSGSPNLEPLGLEPRVVQWLSATNVPIPSFLSFDAEYIVRLNQAI